MVSQAPSDAGPIPPRLIQETVGSMKSVSDAARSVHEACTEMSRFIRGLPDEEKLMVVWG